VGEERHASYFEAAMAAQKVTTTRSNTSCGEPAQCADR
jgi:hypothetical protein